MVHGVCRAPGWAVIPKAVETAADPDMSSGPLWGSACFSSCSQKAIRWPSDHLAKGKAGRALG